MRDGVSWRGGRCQEQSYCSPNQSWKWTQCSVGCRARVYRRGVNILGLFLVSWFVAWTRTRLRTPPSISTESLPRRVFVLKLFRHSGARNRSVPALTPLHRRRQRGLLETPASIPQDIFDEGEQLFDGPFVGDDLTRDFSFQNGSGCRESMAKPLEASSWTRASRRGRKWPVVRRETDELQPLLVEVPIGYHGRFRNHHLQLDTGCSPTWVNCEGSQSVGQAGLFVPLANSFLNCEVERSLCKGFQTCREHPCDEIHNFRCFFWFGYADGTESEGSVIKADVKFALRDAAGVSVSMAFGCASAGKGSIVELYRGDSADEGDDDMDDDEDEDEDDMDDDDGSTDEDDDTMDQPTSFGSSDGILGLGPSSSSWLHQLHLNGLVSEHVFTICLEVESPRHDPPSPFFEPAGFIAFGESQAAQSASTIWTSSVFLDRRIDREYTDRYVAELMGFTYRGTVVNLRSARRELGNTVEHGQRMLFDTGASHTFLNPEIYEKIVAVIEEDAKRMNFEKTAGVDPRFCWHDKEDRTRSLVRDFGDFILNFASLADDGSTSDLAIKPENYLFFLVRL